MINVQKLRRLAGVALVSGAVLLAGLSASPAYASAASDLSALKAMFPGISATAAYPSGTAALTGTIKGKSGKHVGAGIPVLMFAAPSLATTKSVTVGQYEQWQLIAVTLTNSSGKYKFLSSKVTSKLSAMKSQYQEIVVPTLTNDGKRLVNLLAANPGSPHIVNVAGTSSGTKKNTVSNLATHVGNISLTATAVTATKLKAAVKPVSSVFASQPSSSGSLPQAPPISICQSMWYCYWAYDYQTWNQPVAVGASSSTAKGVTALFTFSTGSSASLGTGMSVSGKAGSFSQDSTTKVTSDVTIDFAPTARTGFTRVYVTEYEYATYYAEMVLFGHLDTWYEVTPTGNFVGGDYSKDFVGTMHSTNPSKYCAFYGNGSKVTLDNSAAVTWSNGVSVNVGKAASLNMTSQSGFNQDTSLSYQFTGGTGYVCGVYDYIGPKGKTPGLAYASSTVS